MESKLYLKKAITKIEQNLSEKIKIEHLSSECFVSPRQLYRDFYSYTGHSIHEYIRKRRMSKALSLLKHSSMGIADIAYLCGYSSQQALCKSIKASIYMTPTQYRNHKNTHYYFPLCEENKLRQISVENKSIPNMICINFYHHRLTGIENWAIHSLQSVLTSYSKTLFGRNGLQRGNQFCYELYIEYSEEYIRLLKASQLTDFSIFSAYEGTFAFLSVKNNEEDINEAWDFLYGHWLKTSMFETDDTPYFEEYLIKDNKIKKLILHLPVKPRENFHKINIHSFDDRLIIAAAKTGHLAEKSATNTVINFLSKTHSYLFHTQKEYYVSKRGECYTCGMVIKNPLYLPDNDSFALLTASKGLYAVLEGSCFGSAEEYESVLLQWLKENGFEIIGEPFSIYDISKGVSQNEILVKSQVRIKDGRII